MTEKITKSLDEKHYSVGIFVDLKKAFDTINHNILIHKVSYYGIRGLALNWISRYLKNRSQYVSYNSVNSDFITIYNMWYSSGFHFGTIFCLFSMLMICVMYQMYYNLYNLQMTQIFFVMERIQKL